MSLYIVVVVALPVLCVRRGMSVQEMKRSRARGKKPTWNKLFFWYLIYVWVNRQFEDPEFNSILSGFAFSIFSNSAASSFYYFVEFNSRSIGHNHISLLAAHTSNSHKHCQQSHTHIYFMAMNKKSDMDNYETESEKNEDNKKWENAASEWRATSHKTIY